VQDEALDGGGHRVKASAQFIRAYAIMSLIPRTKHINARGSTSYGLKHIAESFSNERNRLEQQWDRGDNVSTEDLRIALQRYRSFFSRLLSV
jgi:hypothetical protein